MLWYCYDAAAVDEAELDINRILGRKVKNLSKNKYKFVSGSTGSQRKSCRRTPLPRKSQYVFQLCCTSTRSLGSFIGSVGLWYLHITWWCCQWWQWQMTMNKTEFGKSLNFCHLFMQNFCQFIWSKFHLCTCMLLCATATSVKLTTTTCCGEVNWHLLSLRRLCFRIGLFICLSAGLHENSQMNFHEILGKDLRKLLLLLLSRF